MRRFFQNLLLRDFFPEDKRPTTSPNKTIGMTPTAFPTAFMTPQKIRHPSPLEIGLENSLDDFGYKISSFIFGNDP